MNDPLDTALHRALQQRRHSLMGAEPAFSEMLASARSSAHAAPSAVKRSRSRLIWLAAAASLAGAAIITLRNERPSEASPLTALMTDILLEHERQGLASIGEWSPPSDDVALLFLEP